MLQSGESGDDDGGREGSHTPALPTLRDQQHQIRARLREGFDSRRELLQWSHATAAVSVGQVPDGWFADLINDPWVVAACLADETHREHLCGDQAPNDETAQSVRMDIIQDTLSPAFQSALGFIRRQTADYTDDKEGIRHIDKQRYLALRPRLHELAVAQHKAIRKAFGAGGYEPLGSREAVVDWADYVGYSCAGVLPADFTRTVASPLGEWWFALTQGRGATLESILAAEILPAMNQALRTAASEAEELPARNIGNESGGNIS